MKIMDIINEVEHYYPSLGEHYDGCDGVKFGDVNQECTGIATAIVPSIHVIEEAIHHDCNLLYVHEPSFYLTPDFPSWKADFSCETYERKVELLKAGNMVIYRDHDKAHSVKPDNIFFGVIKYLGWEEYWKQEDKTIPFGYLIEFPESLTVREINAMLIDKLRLRGIRYIGRDDARIKRLALVGHLYPGAFIPPTYKDGYYTDYSTEIIRTMELNDVDAIIPGEIIEWNILSYIRDSVELGRQKACFNLGHFNWEQLGSRYVLDWLPSILDDIVKVKYIPSGDIWSYKEVMK